MYNKKEANKRNGDNASEKLNKPRAIKLKKSRENNRELQEIQMIYLRLASMNLYKTYIKNLPTISLSTNIGKYTAQQLIMDQLTNKNCTGIENIILSVITVRSKELAIGRSRLDYIIIHTNQASASIDIRVHSNWDISFGSQKSCNKMSIYFEQKMNGGIRVNPSRTIGSISPYITSMNRGTGIRFGSNSGYGIPPSNIGGFGHFDRGTSDFTDRSAYMAHIKVKVKTLESTEFSKMLTLRMIFKLKKWAQKFCNFKSR